MMTFKGAARRLESLDISKTAHTIGCGEDHLHAVLEVETRGGGFDIHGRPKMLFEPHVFYSELSGSERESAVAAGLAYRRWGEKPYPRDSYPRLQRAMDINATAALRACSWGLGQIMGFNHRLAGYSSALEMVESFLDDEAVQLAAMVSFIISSGLDDELRRQDWTGFARGYNGAGYAKHGYHTKLKKAFDKWQRIPDTPFTPADIDRSDVDPNPPQDPILTTRGMVLKSGMSGPDVENLQGILARLGYHSGKIDGHFGRLTKSSVARFQLDNDLIADGVVGELTWEALASANPVPARHHTVETLRAAGSDTIESADTVERDAKRAGGGLLGLGTVDMGLEVVDKLNSAAGPLEAAQQALLDNWLIIPVLILGALIWWKGPQIAETLRGIRVKDAVAGRNLGR